MNVHNAPALFDEKSENTPVPQPTLKEVSFDSVMAHHRRHRPIVSDEEAQIFDIAKRMKTPISISNPDLVDHPIVFVNRALEYLTGYSAETMIGANCRFLQGKDTDRAEVAKVRDAVERRQPTEVVLLNYTAQGDPFHNLLVIRPLWVSVDHCLLIGCQHEFNFGVRRREIERRTFSRFDNARELSLKARDQEAKTRQALIMRSEAMVSRIQTHLYRRAAML
ncbi:hypothetical protein So717_01590 [Roseobacter cerasinus]|uniref:PAS domain-containing protein n=1 Tax=Roseobacter cerasinus TaxID=2602289 RepID=A0A640VQC2_9RHOB|nr:PAS domain-containing protein [Roseobacter cerasinus]GFE48406.1 hypothetical protein So717_01590 [Roseobacter cerasinus]